MSPAPAASTPRRRTADVRTALVDAAERVLERDGITGLTVRAVAAEAGVAPMGVYNHLQGKDGLLLAVLARAFDRLTAVTTWHPELAPAASLRRMGEDYRRFALATPVTYGLMFGSAGSWQGVAGAQEVGARADAAFEGLVDALRTAQQFGIVRAGDPRLLADALWSAVHGAMSLELFEGKPTAEGAAEITYAAVLDMIERGLAP